MGKVNERLHIHACGLKDRPVAIEIDGEGKLPVVLTADEAIAFAYQVIALAEGRTRRTVPRIDTRQKERSILWDLPHTL